ncbi:MAG: hypothetical protein LBS60_11670 [Deltaproteobacteria bacterium]|jgi:hypothetical protein|nr:hypothetical protein [Deltaproteobacteria bacterium]
MYFKTSTIKGKTYLQLVESYRKDGQVKRRVIARFGQLEKAINSGALERFLTSGARMLKNTINFSELKEDDISSVTHMKVGTELVFDCVWSKLGIDKEILTLCSGKNFDFSVERLMFSARSAKVSRSYERLASGQAFR